MNNYTISTNDIYFLNDKNIISAIDDNLLTNKINPIASYDVVANMSSYVNNEITTLIDDISYLSTQISNNNTCVITSVDTLHTVINSLSDSISSNYALISAIPLSTSQLINNGIENGAFLLSNNVTISAINDDGTEYIKLYINHKEFASLNANNFTKDGML